MTVQNNDILCSEVVVSASSSILIGYIISRSRAKTYYHLILEQQNEKQFSHYAC